MGAPAAAKKAEEELPPFKSVLLILSALTFCALGITYFLAKPEVGSSFAFIFCAALAGLGVFLAIGGINRFSAKDRAYDRLDELHFGTFFLRTWNKMDKEGAKERAAAKGYDWNPLVALVVGAVALSLMEYFGGARTYIQLCDWMHGDSIEDTFWRDLRTSHYARLYEFVWWSGWRVFGYFIIPCIAIKLMKQNIRDFGLETKGFVEHSWIYFFGFIIIFIAVVIVSYTDEFSTYYPFYKPATRSWFDLISWEVLYAAQFFSLEFFFRGYWIKALKRSMGSHAIFAMVVPYCMIHYGKPFPETMGAIAAGVVLGTLSMKTRSIWSGFLIHVSVAVSMDVAALLQTTGIPRTFWPELP